MLDATQFLAAIWSKKKGTQNGCLNKLYSLCLFDAVHGADLDTAGAAFNTFTFVTKVGIDYVDIAFFDRVVWTFRQAESTSSALVSYLHCHLCRPPS